MKLIFYAKGKTAAGDRLLQKIEDQVSADIVEAYRNLDDFQQGLLRQRREPNLDILMVANTAELKQIIALGKLLADARILLILPDRRKETVATGHRLRPSYIGYADSDFEDVVAVIKQILKLSPPHVPQELESAEMQSGLIGGN